MKPKLFITMHFTDHNLACRTKEDKLLSSCEARLNTPHEYPKIKLVDDDIRPADMTTKNWK